MARSGNLVLHLQTKLTEITMSVENMLSRTVASMTESATLRMAQKARDLSAKGIEVISLSIGEPDFDTPEHIKQAAVEGLKRSYTKYTPVTGLPELKNAICQKLKRDNGLDYVASEIIVSNGAKQSIANVCMSLLNPGDEVIIFAPYWVSYHDIVRFCQGTPIVVSAGVEQDYKVNARQLEAAITSKTKLLIFSSPCNPSGSVFTRDELAAIADVVRRHPGFMVISDEIYEYINFIGEHCSLANFDGMKERVALVNGMSKGFSMTGWRLGYMAGPAWLVSACNKVQGQITSGANSFGQYAAAVALLSDLGPTKAMTAAFKQRRDLVISLLREIRGMKVNQPAGAFYIFPDVSAFFGKSNGTCTIHNSDDMEELLLTHAHVAVVGGASFGSPNCIRLSYAASESQLREAISRIRAFLDTFDL